MSNWRIVDETYIYDGTIEGFLTVVSQSLKLKILPNNITSENAYRDNLLDTPVFIETDFSKSDKILNLINNISSYSMYNLYTAFLSGNEDKENIILKYTLSLFKYGKKYDFMKSDDWQIAVSSMSGKVAKESHRLKGFLRFREIPHKILYSEIEPENNVLELLARHFKERLKNEAWIIFDKKRNIAAIYNKQEYVVTTVSEFNLKKLTDNEEEEIYQKLWKDYFHNISIKERKNLRCQMNFMPKKYWKYLTEMRGD